MTLNAVLWVEYINKKVTYYELCSTCYDDYQGSYFPLARSSVT